MLASEPSAEHFARQWLDAVRYADTHGIHIDNYRSIWPYRDWVIRAFRDNIPFDRFTVEQVAGDLLPGATLAQQVASGFNRCLPTTSEGGAIAEEYEAIYAKDRVETVATVWLGLTLGCAACHDHKFDPVSAKDFYAFAAFFRNNTMPAMDGNRYDTPPTLFVPSAGDEARWSELQALLKGMREEEKSRATAAEADFKAWLDQSPRLAVPPADHAVRRHEPLRAPRTPWRGPTASRRRLDGWIGWPARRCRGCGANPAAPGLSCALRASPPVRCSPVVPPGKRARAGKCFSRRARWVCSSRMGPDACRSATSGARLPPGRGGTCW
jgi:hypothetical protein